MDVLKWISSRRQITPFIKWVEEQKGEVINANLFRRAKANPAEDMTDRQFLVLEFAQEYYQSEIAKRELVPAEA